MSEHRARRVLVVATHFAPTNAPDGQRARLCLPSFADFGWEAEVLSADPALCAAPLDPLLAEGLPANIPIYRHGALPRALGRLLGVNNIALRARFHLRAAAARLLREGRFDLVFFSTTQWAALHPAPEWRKRHGIRYVVDLQDPWVTQHYDTPGAPRPPGGWKYRLQQASLRRHEATVLGAASGLAAVSQGHLDDLANRYPNFNYIPSAVIPFGASPADLATALSAPAARAAVKLPADTVNLVYTGALGEVLAPSLVPLLRALAALRTSAPTLASRLRLHLYGTRYSDQACTPADTLENQLAREAGVEDLLVHRPARLAFHESLRLMAEADATLVLGSGDPDYVPSKIAQVALASRRILTIAASGSATARACLEAGFPAPFDTLAPGTTENLALHLRALAEGRLPTRSPGAPLPPRLDSRESTRRLCALFNEALSTP